MGKKDLKKQYSEFDVSVIDYVSRIDPSNTNKLTPFLLKIISNKLKSNGYLFTKNHHFEGIEINNRIDRYVIEMLLDIMGEGSQGIQTLKEFNEHLENNRIENNDISQYETWEELLTQKGLADIKLMDKESIKRVERIYEDSTWLVIKPLSFDASLAYGSGTKWCTAMKNEPHYFYKYCTEGILIYTINKTNGKKFGIFSSPNEVSFWNTIDNRIDSIESGIPFEILSLIREKIDLDNNPRNVDLFCDEEINNQIKHYQQIKTYDEEPVMMSEEYPEVEERGYYEESMEDEVELVSYEQAMPEIQHVTENYFRIFHNGDVPQQG